MALRTLSAGVLTGTTAAAIFTARVNTKITSITITNTHAVTAANVSVIKKTRESDATYTDSYTQGKDIAYAAGDWSIEDTVLHMGAGDQIAIQASVANIISFLIEGEEI
jgi:hypothetical protein